MKENWEKVLEYFEKNFKKYHIKGLCGVVREMRAFYLLTVDEKNDLTVEIFKDLQEKDITELWLFRPYDYESRLKYIKDKIKKYS